MNSFFISVITFLALLFPLVVIHEFGHFFTARLMKVKVLEFGFGFPPKLYSFWTGKTKISNLSSNPLFFFFGTKIHAKKILRVLSAIICADRRPGRD